MVPLRIRAVVLAGSADDRQGGEMLFAAGTLDVVDPEDPPAALEGRKGAILRVFSARDGELLGSRPLPLVPAFDGLTAAGGRLYLAGEDGKLLCLAGGK